MFFFVYVFFDIYIGYVVYFLYRCCCVCCKTNDEMYLIFINVFFFIFYCIFWIKPFRRYDLPPITRYVISYICYFSIVRLGAFIFLNLFVSVSFVTFVISIF